MWHAIEIESTDPILAMGRNPKIGWQSLHIASSVRALCRAYIPTGGYWQVDESQDIECPACQAKLKDRKQC